MAPELRLSLAFWLALTLTWASVPLAIRLARRIAFYDRPIGYKGHHTPTPYLGGLAVLAGVLPAALLFADGAGRYDAVFGCGLLLLVLGTVDDRVSIAPRYRVAAEVGVALLLWHAGIHWSVTGSAAVDLPITIVWVVGFVNAFNLLDNLDGATATVAGVSAAGIGLLAAARGDFTLAAACLAVSGACAGFLRYNLASPARIFLGDGGSLPLGLFVAGAAMAAPLRMGSGMGMIVTAVPLVGVAALDTSLVIISRKRRGLSFLTPGRDHVTHRLLVLLRSPRRVAAAIGLLQGALSLAVVGAALSSGALAVAVAVLYGVGVLLAIAALERQIGYGTRYEAPHPRADAVPETVPSLVTAQGSLDLAISFPWRSRFKQPTGRHLSGRSHGRSGARTEREAVGVASESSDSRLDSGPADNAESSA